MYFLPIQQFGFVLLCGSPYYKLRSLIMLERSARRLCLGLPRYVPIKILYLEGQIPELVSRMDIFTVDAFLRLMESPISRSKKGFVTWLSRFFGSTWPPFKQPQAIFVQSLPGPLNMAFLSAPVFDLVSPLHIIFL